MKAVKVEKEGRRKTAKLHRGIWSLGSRGTQVGELLKKCYKEISPVSGCEFRSFGVSCSRKDCSATWETVFFRGTLVRREAALVCGPFSLPVASSPG